MTKYFIRNHRKKVPYDEYCRYYGKIAPQNMEDNNEN